MKRKKIVSMLLVATMAATLFAGCGNDSGKKGSSGGAKEFDAFFAVPGSEMNDDNEIQKIIEEKTGVRVNETWLTGQTADEAIGTMIAGGEYPDFIEGASGQMQLYDAGALVPLDDYIEKCGGLTQKSGQSKIIVMHQDGSAVDADDVDDVVPGDEIMVLPKYETKNLEVTRGISTILYQMAVAAKVILDL